MATQELANMLGPWPILGGMLVLGVLIALGMVALHRHWAPDIPPKVFLEKLASSSGTSAELHHVACGVEAQGLQVARPGAACVLYPDRFEVQVPDREPLRMPVGEVIDIRLAFVKVTLVLKSGQKVRLHPDRANSL